MVLDTNTIMSMEVGREYTLKLLKDEPFTAFRFKEGYTEVVFYIKLQNGEYKDSILEVKSGSSDGLKKIVSNIENFLQFINNKEEK